jgi:hypothetical protein
MTKNWKKFTDEKITIFGVSKTTIYLFLGLHKLSPSYGRRRLQPSKENIKHFKHEKSKKFLFLWG